MRNVVNSVSVVRECYCKRQLHGALSNVPTEVEGHSPLRWQHRSSPITGTTFTPTLATPVNTHHKDYAQPYAGNTGQHPSQRLRSPLRSHRPTPITGTTLTSTLATPANTHHRDYGHSYAGNTGQHPRYWLGLSVVMRYHARHYRDHARHYYTKKKTELI